ncbi:MAG: SMI1/KNR4 family protein [Gemmatimonadales bacterium]|nr:SMI1/KNR4 family protein [Gemmatimonadales bacterium]
MVSLVAEITKRWRASGLAPRPGVSEEQFRDFEERHRVRFPDDLKEYFRTVDGMDDGEWDEHLIRFWPLAMMRPVVAVLPELNRTAYDGYFVFADYSAWAHGYAVRMAAGGNEVAIVGGDDPIRIAPSFGDFLRGYLQRSEVLFR